MESGVERRRGGGEICLREIVRVLPSSAREQAKAGSMDVAEVLEVGVGVAGRDTREESREGAKETRNTRRSAGCACVMLGVLSWTHLQRRRTANCLYSPAPVPCSLPFLATHIYIVISMFRGVCHTHYIKILLSRKPGFPG